MKPFALASLAALLLASSAYAEMAPVRSITVNGMAERKVVPDEAHVNVNLNAQNKDMNAAKTAHDAKLKKLLGITRDAGIDEKKVATQSSSIQPVYTYRNDGNGNSQRVFEGYRVQTGLDITVGDTKKLGGLMDAISKANFEQGANTEWGNLMNVYYTLSNPDKLRDDMLVQAIGNAQAKAERMVSAANASLGNVYQIQESGTPQFQPVMAMTRAAPMMMKESADAAPPAGEQEVQANVTVTYELK